MIEAFISKQFICAGDPHEIQACLRNAVDRGAEQISIRDESEIGAAFIVSGVEDEQK